MLDEKEFMQGMRDCKNGYCPKKNPSDDYIKGYSHRIDSCKYDFDSECNQKNKIGKLK